MGGFAQLKVKPLRLGKWLSPHLTMEAFRSAHLIVDCCQKLTENDEILSPDRFSTHYTNEGICSSERQWQREELFAGFPEQNQGVFNISKPSACEMTADFNGWLFADEGNGFKSDRQLLDRTDSLEIKRSGRKRKLSQSSDRNLRRSDYQTPVSTEPEVLSSLYPLESWVDTLPSISRPDNISNYSMTASYEDNSSEITCPPYNHSLCAPTNEIKSTTKRVKKRKPQTSSQRKAATLRERRRIEGLKTAFQNLKENVPTFSYETDLTRLETLRLAVKYIGFLSDVLNGQHPDHVILYTHHMDMPL